MPGPTPNSTVTYKSSASTFPCEEECGTATRLQLPRNLAFSCGNTENVSPMRRLVIDMVADCCQIGVGLRVFTRRAQRVI